MEEKQKSSWKGALVQAGAFISVIIIAFAAAVPLANRSVRRDSDQKAKE